MNALYFYYGLIVYLIASVICSSIGVSKKDKYKGYHAFTLTLGLIFLIFVVLNVFFPAQIPTWLTIEYASSDFTY